MFNGRLKRILTTPPYVLAKKVYKKLGTHISLVSNRKRDLNNDTRVKKKFSLVSRLFIDIKDIDVSVIDKNSMEFLTKMYIKHSFNLLGSGWVKVEYGMKCPGFEGYKYNMALKMNKFDRKGRWLKNLLLNAHLESSQKVWQMVDKDYIPIDWQLDFKSGYRWSTKTWYRDIKYGHVRGVDIKVPWELARMQHLPQMAIYALAFPEYKKKLISEFKNQILGFISINPPRLGVNWTCAMDVAIRVVNWLVAYNIICQIDNEQEILDEEFKQVFTSSAYEHGIHILSNLEWSQELTSNHYLSDITGLLILAVFTEKTFKEAEEWKEFAIRELKKEMFKQVYPDGIDFEASTCYHRLVLELFFYSTFFAVQSVKPEIENEKRDTLSSEDDYKTIAEEIFGVKYATRLYKMFDAVLYLLKPNGRMPQIGDNDNGQFIKLYPREVLDMRYLLALGAVFFKEPKWKIKEFFESDEDIAEVRILYGKKGVEIWNSLEWNSLKNINSKAFTDSGWYVMRNDKDYCIISCGPNGQNGKGGHCHNDKLSFELCINGKDIIVDPGTYVYTSLPEWRNKFRSTACHNTVIIDEKEQNRFAENNLFFTENDSIIEIEKWKTFEEYDILEVVYNKQKRIKDSITHCRQFIFNKKEKQLEIVDIFKGEGEHRLEWNLILSPNFEGDLKIQSESSKFKQIQWQKKSSFYSPEYGVINKTNKLTAMIRAKMPLEIKYLLKDKFIKYLNMMIEVF